MPPGAGRGGGHRQDVIFLKILRCRTKIFDEERANKLMMSCRLRNVLAKPLKTNNKYK